MRDHVQSGHTSHQKTLAAISQQEKRLLGTCQTQEGVLKIDKTLLSLLVAAFKDHPHDIVAPNAKDTLQLKNADGKKVSIRKVLTRVGLETSSLTLCAIK
jgi:hypothetical protein